MSSRKPFIAANWKMHPRPEDLTPYRPTEKVDAAVFCIPFDINACLGAGIVTGGQFGHSSDTGAHTGDISMKMLAEYGCSHVLCGHSERRKFHCETDTFIGAQLASALKNDLHPILCIGETEKEHKEERSKEVVKNQFEIAYAQVDGEDITIAYEPVWAISGGDPDTPAATPEDAEEMHAFIRGLLPKGKQESTRILYGGSMKPENAEGLLKQSNIDGGLVGGASLHPEKFQKLIEIASMV